MSSIIDRILAIGSGHIWVLDDDTKIIKCPDCLNIKFSEEIWSCVLNQQHDDDEGDEGDETISWENDIYSRDIDNPNDLKVHYIILGEEVLENDFDNMVAGDLIPTMKNGSNRFYNKRRVIYFKDDL